MEEETIPESRITAGWKWNRPEDLPLIQLYLGITCSLYFFPLVKKNENEIGKGREKQDLST